MDEEAGKGGAGFAAGAASPSSFGPDWVEAVGWGVLELGPRGVVSWASPVAESVFGAGPGGLSGRHYTEILSPDSAQDFYGIFRRAYRSASPVAAKGLTVILAGGASKVVDVHASVVCGDSGEVRTVRGMVKEVVPEPPRAGLAALESPALQVCLLNGEGRVTFANAAWRKEDAAGSGLCDTEEGGDFLEALQRSHRSGRPSASDLEEGLRGVLSGRRSGYSLEYLCSWKDSPSWQSVTAHPLKEGGPEAGLLLVRRDVTERKLNQQELQTLYQALDASIDGLALLNPSGEFLYANPAFAHIHGFEAPVDLAGKRWSDLYPPEEYTKLKDLVFPHLKRVGYWSGELRGRKQGGEDLYQSLSLTYVDRGRLLICSVRDVSEQKAHEEALRASEEAFRTIFEGVRDGIAVVDPEGLTIKAANKALGGLFGYASPDPLLGRPLLDLLAPEDRQGVVERASLARAGGQASVHRCSAIRADGSVIQVDCNGSFTVYRNREAFLLTLRDVTAEVRALSALEMSERRLRAFFEGAPDSIFIKDGSLRYVQGNPAMARLLGIPVEEIPGKSDIDLFGPEVGAHIQEADRRVLAGEALEEEAVKPVAGTLHYFHTVKVPIRDVDGRVAGLCGIARDVTDRRREQEALKESEARFRHIVESVPDCYFYVHDEEGRYKYISPNIQAMTGYTPEYFQGPHAPLATDHPMNAESDRISERCLREGVAPPPLRWEIRHKEGRKRIIEAYERPVLREGKVVEVYGLCQDITRRLEMEERLARYREMELAGRLTSKVAREVEEPIIALGVTVQALQRKLGSGSPADAYLDVMAEQVKRLSDLLRDLTDLGREDGASERESRRVDFLIREALDAVEWEFPGEGNRVRTGALGAGLRVRVNGPRIVRALVHVMGNALKFSPAESPVIVEAERAGGEAVIRVEDRGSGFPEGILERAFDPFVSASGKRAGLGLAIVLRTVEDHGGKVWIRGNEGFPGATVRISLPLAEEEGPRAPGRLEGEVRR
ncbi:MAG: PAS domain S-box protein [Acidobacteriota bacterium]